jgi:5-methylcytosine-specific restriction endonuclease McrA
MSFFDKLEWSNKDKRSLFAEVLKCTGDWSTEKPAIKKLRARLLILQKYRCAYCQYPIPSDLVGYRELDHILPKEGNSNQPVAKKKSEQEDDRYATDGYPQFKFQPKNLAIICKPCNSSKGTYDSLTNRGHGRSLVRYPPANRFICFHPHYHNYAAHIQIDENFIYSHSTDEGRVLLQICGLMKVEILEKKFAPAALKITLPGRDLFSITKSLTMQLQERNLGLSHVVNALIINRKLTSSEAHQLMTQSLRCNTERDTLLLKQACQRLEARMKAPRQTRGKKVIAKALK